MATSIIRIGAWENEQVLATLEYDDVRMRLTAARVVNNTQEAILINVIRTSDGLIYSQRFPPGETFINIPTAASGRINIQDLGRGRWGGYSISALYPYP